MLWFCEYFREGSGEPVNLSIGLRSIEAAIVHGKKVSQFNGYCGFWISCKCEGSREIPERVQFHGVTYDMRGYPTWRKMIYK